MKNVYANESVMTLPESIQAEATLSAQTMEINFGLLRGKESLLDIKVSMHPDSHKDIGVQQQKTVLNAEHYIERR